ncbi:hypothetical protein PRO82_000654 [Candidatus Protochlamydia amoebophila]|nr:hypothetical protein [Candidatus Protochlamydia amoebophila]
MKLIRKIIHKIKQFDSLYLVHFGLLIFVRENKIF